MPLFRRRRVCFQLIQERSMQHFICSVFHSAAWRAAAAIFIGAVLMSGCATSSRTEALAPAPSYETLIKDADVALSRGQREKSVALLTQAAHQQPTNMQPWLKIANTWFEAGNYPAAILAANEVLQRDAANAEAKGLLVVAGLRVAAGAVGELRPNGPLAPNARQEAEDLTKSLRALLGEQVLVPPVAAEQKPARLKSRPRPASSSTAPAQARAAPKNQALQSPK
jgi:hypothetical protein